MENIKSDILNTAAALFKKCGLRSVSIDDVCKELHISKKTFYNFFKQKDELIEQVLQALHEQKRCKTKLPWIYDENKNIIDVLMTFDKEIRMSAEEEKKHLVMFFDLEKYYPKIFQKRIRIMQEHNRETMKSFVNKGLEEGVFREDLDAEMMAMFLAVQIDNYVNYVKENMQDKKKDDVRRAFKFFRDAIIRILANKKGMMYYLENYYNQ